MQNNTFNEINCTQNGGIFHAQYYASDSLETLINDNQTTIEHSLIVTIQNNVVTNVNASSGGFLFMSGESRLLEVDIENNQFDSIDSHQNGGLFIFVAA